MSKNSTEIQLDIEALEHKIEEVFGPLWDLGVLGVKVIQHNQNVKVFAYLLSNAEISDVSPALHLLASELQDNYTVEETVIHGVVPCNRIQLQLAA